MKRKLPLLFALACATAFAEMLAFTTVNAVVTNNGLRISFTETGLTAGSSASFNATANATATWGCFNRGGNNPNSKNKRTTATDNVTGTVSLTANPSGVISGVVNVPAPKADNFSCPKGQDLALSSVSFSNVHLQDTTNNTSTNVSGTFGKVFRKL